MILASLLLTSFSAVAVPQGGMAPDAASGLSAGEGEGVALEDVDRPRLVVLLAVDQMIPEQLERLAPRLHGGLGRLLRSGAVFERASHDFARTETGAGHTTLGTGALPKTHGIVGNSFYDREQRRVQYCVEDPDVHAITSAGPVLDTGRRSPRNILVPTLGERMQAAIPGAQVVSISAKDRAAIGMGGRSKGPVLWWDKKGAGYHTSSFYGDALPGFVTEWNQGWLDAARGWTWDSTVGDGAAHLGTDADERPGERPFSGQGVTLPYTLPADAKPATLAGLVYQSPLADRFTAELGLAAVRELGLGEDDATDLLCLSFSSCDVVGHANGPYSLEVTDLLLRLDRTLADVFAELDERVGPGEWVAALSADHGVLPLPEWLSAHGQTGARVPGGQISAFRKSLRAAMKEALGADIRIDRGSGGLYFDADALEEAGMDPVEARAKLVKVVRGLMKEHAWIEAVYSLEELAALPADASGPEKLLRASQRPERLVDVTVLQRPGLLLGYANGTSHGTHHWYDRHVPLLFMGSGVPAGVRSDAAGTHDVVPTLLGLLGIPASDVDGRNLFGGN